MPETGQGVFVCVCGGGGGFRSRMGARHGVMHRPAPERNSVFAGLGQGNEHNGLAWLPGVMGVMGIKRGWGWGWCLQMARRSQTPGEGAGVQCKWRMSCLQAPGDASQECRAEVHDPGRPAEGAPGTDLRHLPACWRAGISHRSWKAEACSPDGRLLAPPLGATELRG